MANNVAASMKASIVIDKKEIISSALKAYAEAQKELDGNKIELLVDVSDDKALKKLKEIQKELTGKEYILKFKNQGTDEILESLDVLEKRLKDIFSGKAFGTGTGKGIGNPIVDEKSLQSVLDLFTKMESHLGDMKRVFSDVGDGGEFSPLLSTIDKINSSITELSKSVKGIRLNMNIDFGSDKELEAKAEAKISNALQAYQRLFDHIKMTGVGGSIITQKFFDFDINQFDGMMGKLNAYKKFIENMRTEAKSQFNGNDVLYQETDKKYWTSVSSAMGQVTKAFNEMKASGDTNPLKRIFGGSQNLTEVVSQLSLIVNKLDEISKSAFEFKGIFKEGLNVSSSVEEIEKLTNRVKELEEELSKVKLATITVPTPIEDTFQRGYSDNSEPFTTEKILEAKKAEEKIEKDLQKQKDSFNKKNLTAIDLEIQKREELSKITSSDIKTQMEERQKLVSSMESEIKSLNERYDALNLKPSDANRSIEYQEALDRYKSAITDLQLYLDELNKTPVISEEQKNHWNELIINVNKASNELKSFSAAEKGSTEAGRWKEIDKISKYLDKNTRISKEAKQELNAYLELLKSGSAVNIEEIHMQFNKIAEAERLAGREGKRFWDILTDKAVYGAAAQLAGYYLSLTDFIRYGKEGINVVRELDTALTEMRKVSDETVTNLERFQDVSFDLADGVGTTAKAIQDATADWMRLGESLEEAKQSAQDANVLFRVSEFESIDEATESLVAMSAAYKDLEKSQINDVLNEIGNNYAISTDELASALQKSAATLSVAGNDIYEAAALVTAGNAVLQDADSVGTGLKMISLRILGTQEAKDELVSLGEDVDDFVVQTKSKIDETVRNFTAVASNDFKGISVLDDNGNYRSTYEILRDISQVYQEILETDKKAGTNRGQALLEVLAGKNRSNVAASILQSPELLTSAYDSAMKSAGSAQKELDKYLESIDGRMQKLENQAQEFWFKLIDSDTIKGGIDLLTGLLDIVTKLVDTFGAFGTAAMVGGGILGAKNVGKRRSTMFHICFEYADRDKCFLY